MTSVIIMVVGNDGNINTRILGAANISFHGKFYITFQGHDYNLKHPPIYAENKDQVILVCSELKEGEEINSYGEPDCILVTDAEKSKKYISEEEKRYLKYDWEYTPYIESTDDHINFFIDAAEISEETMRLLPKDAGLSVAAYLKETGYKSIWKDGSPKIVID